MDIIEKRILHGDQEAFKEWMEMRIRLIERFALQYGASLERAGAVAESVFRDLYESLGDLTEGRLRETSLFINALLELDSKKLGDFSGLSSFEEDNELHRRLIALPKELRVPFILNRFHNKSLKVISEIMGGTEQQAEQAVNEAVSVLRESDLDKKLEFLSKSYERLTPSYNETNIFHSKVEEIQPVEQKSEMKRKNPFLFWGLGAGILLVLLSIITYINSDAYQKKSAEKFIEQARVSFQEELKHNLQLTGLPEPVYLRSDIYAETYGEDTRRKFDWFIADLEDQLERDGKIDMKKAKTEYDLLLHELMVPSEMVAELAREPLVNDPVKSMDFVNAYVVKMSTLMRSYMFMYRQNEHLMQQAGWNDEGGYNLEAFFAKKSDYPKEFREALDGMEAQGFVLRNDKNLPARYVAVYPAIGNPDIAVVLHENLHPDTSIYLATIMGDLIDIQNRSIDEQTDILLQLEKGLLQAEGYQVLHSLTSNAFISMVYSITGMDGNVEIRDSDGTIKEEYKEAWTRIAFNGKNSPSGHMMRKVVAEMEDSGWTTSEYLDRLHYFFIEGEVKKILKEMKK